MELENGIVILYECDPELNTSCRKEFCAEKHPDNPNLQCHRTTHPEFAKAGTARVAVDIRTGKERKV